MSRTRRRMRKVACQLSREAEELEPTRLPFVDLYELAADVGIAGRSSMNKRELCDALLGAHGFRPLSDDQAAADGDQVADQAAADGDAGEDLADGDQADDQAAGDAGDGDQVDDQAAADGDHAGDGDQAAGDAGDLNALTKAQLYDLATQQQIDGRSTMNKGELIIALSEP